MDSKNLETEHYAHFLYGREIVFAIKCQVRVRILQEDLVTLRKVRTFDGVKLIIFEAEIIPFLFLHFSVAPIGP